MALFQDDKMECTDDDSYEMVNSEDFDFVMTDPEEDSSAESELQKNGLESLDLDNEDEFDMYGKFQCKTVAYQKEYDNVYEFPAHIKRKEDMEIKDVVKDHALPFLPAKTLVRFRTVSKDWDQWIVGPLLAFRQAYSFRDVSGFFCQYGNGVPTFVTLNGSAYGIPRPSLGFLPEPVVIRSSCNGLLLCQGCDGENVYYICNPVNKEWKALPQPNDYHGSEPAIVLAFEPSLHNIPAHYQLICAVPSLDQPIVYFEIYSSEKRSWRRSPAVCFELGDSILKDGGFYMKGIAYWETASGMVLAFVLKDELHVILPLPLDRAPNGVLTQMHGELCYICAHNQAGNAYIIDIYGGINMSLKQSVTIDLELVGSVIRNCRALPCINSDVMVILIGSTVYSYHVKDQKVEVISGAGNNFSARYLPYVNSLVSVARK